MKNLKYFNTISDFNNVKYDFSTPTISYVEEDKNIRYNSYDNVNTYYGFSFKNDFRIVNNQSKLEYCKILDTDELLTLTGNGELIYPTGGENKLWHIEMKFKDEVTDFTYMFDGSDIWKVSENIFSNCLNATNFTGVFQGCTYMTEVPENLFKYNTEVTNFRNAFNRVSMSSLPEKLFNNNTKVTTFEGTFCNCSELTSIPTNLFSNNTAVTSFNAIFQYCWGLKNIHENLFINNTAVTDFKYAFQSCSKLNGNVPIDSDGTPIYNRSTPGKDGYSIVTSYDGCFQDCTGLTDYDLIPTDWK